MPHPAEDSRAIADAKGPIVHAIYRISRMNRTVIAGLLRSSGVFPGQELLLMQLFERDGRSQTDLVRALGLDPSTVTKMLQRMERAGWVRRRQADHDRRVVLITLTDEGRLLRDKVEAAWQAVERLTTECLSDRQLEPLRALLSCIEEHVAENTACAMAPGPARLAAVGGLSFTD
ncbi:MAG: MarR family winged helix-turn-helix transcriptional regulator [Acidimicrobiales bacterium]